MNINIIKDNPIELLRLKKDMTQNEFASALKYGNVHQYAYHKNIFSEDIRKRILDAYSVDLTSDIIAYLLAKIRSLRPEKRRVRNSQTRNDTGSAQLSDLIKRMNREV